MYVYLHTKTQHDMTALVFLGILHGVVQVNAKPSLVLMFIHVIICIYRAPAPRVCLCVCKFVCMYVCLYVCMQFTRAHPYHHQHIPCPCSKSMCVCV